MTMCAIGNLGAGALLAVDSQATERGSWATSIREGDNPKKLTCTLSNRESFGMVGAGDGEFVRRITGHKESSSWQTLSTLVEHVSLSALALIEERLVDHCLEEGKEHTEGLHADDAREKVADLMEQVAPHQVASVELLTAKVGSSVEMHHVAGAGTLARKVHDPYLVIGSGRIAFDEWRQKVEVQVSSLPSPENVALDILCVFSLGYSVTGVGGTPEISIVEAGHVRTVDPQTSIALLNLAGVYLAGRIDRSSMERIMALFMRGAKLGDLLPENHFKLDDTSWTLIPELPLAYDVWKHRVGASPSKPVAEVGPFPIYGQGLRRKTAASSAGSEARCANSDFFLQRKELAGKIAFRPPPLEQCSALALDPDTYGDEGGEIGRTWLWPYVQDSRAGKGPLGSNTWLLEPFGRMAIVPLFIHQAAGDAKSDVRAELHRVLSLLWVRGVVWYWRTCLPKGDTRREIKMAKDMADLAFGRFPSPRLAM